MPRNLPLTSTTATTIRSWTRTRIRSGHLRETSAARTGVNDSTRSRTASRSARASGSPRGTAATRSTCSVLSIRVPSTVTPSTANREEKKTAHKAASVASSRPAPTTTMRSLSHRVAHWRRANLRRLSSVPPDRVRRGTSGIGPGQQIEDERTDRGDRPRSQGEHHVAWGSQLHQHGGSVLESRNITDLVRRERYGVGDQRPGPHGISVLPGQVAVEHAHAGSGAAD